jgi:hypothetical protein
VPARGSCDYVLGRWLNKQRAQKKSGQLSVARIAQLDALGVVWDMPSAQWAERFASLQRFKKVTGHCEVPRGYAADPKLATWLSVQRREKQAGKLLPDRSAKLEELGVAWDPHTRSWERRFESLVIYKMKTGHCEVPCNYPPDPALPRWITHQRAAKRRGTLDKDRSLRLANLGLRWNPREADEQAIYKELVCFHAQFGHCNIPSTHPFLGAVGEWLVAQRAAKRRGKIPQERVARLESLGVSWDPHADAWEQRYEALTQFKEGNGHCEFPKTYRKDIGLYLWLMKQRADFTRGILPRARQNRLEQLGVVMRKSTDGATRNCLEKDVPSPQVWTAMLEQLREFRNKYGHGNVPITYSENKLLGRWLARQREKWRKGKLTQTKVADLEMLGVERDPLFAAKEEVFASLEAFNRDHGHCNVPESHPVLYRLGAWLTRKRIEKRRGKLDKGTVRRLESLGIEWDPWEAAWETQFMAIRRFLDEHGHDEIPMTTPANISLATWAAGQRARKRQGTLEPERERRLHGIGFSWNPAAESLESMFAELEAFKFREGHCNVPYDYPARPGLGAWLSAQRSARKRGTLAPDRFERLESLGVVWNPRWEGGIRLTGFEAKLCEFCGEPFVPSHGSAKHCSPDCYIHASVEVDVRTGCKLWKGSLDSKGRPHAHWGGKRRKAYILAFELAGGVLPEGKLLRHLCNSPHCCNPDHLKVGTHVENMADKAASGVAAGEKAYKALLTNQQACEIYGTKGRDTAAEIASQFGVPADLVRRIWNGDSYAKSTGEVRVFKGRLRGESNPAAKCSNKTAIAIYEEKMVGSLSAAATARKFGVSDQMVRNIWEGKTYSNITGAEMRKRNRKRKNQKCVVCGMEIMNAQGNRRFCSWQCSLSAHIFVGKQEECWPWAGERPARGYGQITFCGERAMAHIVAFDLANPSLVQKRLEEGLTVSHSCHNSVCCNPAHLSLLTIRENSAANRGRHDMSGESNPRAKIDSTIAIQIKRLIAEGLSNADIRNRIKADSGIEVSSMIVADIRRGRTWRLATQK